MDSVLDATVRRINNYQKYKERLANDIDYVIHNIANPEARAAMLQCSLIKTIFIINEDELLSEELRTSSLKCVLCHCLSIF